MITDIEARRAAMTIIRYCVEHTCDTCAISHACYKLRGEEMPCLCIEEETMKNMTAGEEELLLYAKRIKMYCDYMLNDTDGNTLD